MMKKKIPDEDKNYYLVEETSVKHLDALKKIRANSKNEKRSYQPKQATTLTINFCTEYNFECEL